MFQHSKVRAASSGLLFMNYFTQMNMLGALNRKVLGAFICYRLLSYDYVVCFNQKSQASSRCTHSKWCFGVGILFQWQTWNRLYSGCINIKSTYYACTHRRHDAFHETCHILCFYVLFLRYFVHVYMCITYIFVFTCAPYFIYT